MKKDRQIENPNATQNPSTSKPLMNSSLIKIMQALITNRNKPSVTNVTGSVRRMSNGLIVAFKSASTRATSTALQMSFISTPGNIHAMINALTAVTMIRMANLSNNI